MRSLTLSLGNQADVMMDPWNPRIWEMKTWGSEVQGLVWLHEAKKIKHFFLLFIYLYFYRIPCLRLAFDSLCSWRWSWSPGPPAFCSQALALQTIPTLPCCLLRAYFVSNCHVIIGHIATTQCCVSIHVHNYIIIKGRYLLYPPPWALIKILWLLYRKVLYVLYISKLLFVTSA